MKILFPDTKNFRKQCWTQHDTSEPYLFYANVKYDQTVVSILQLLEYIENNLKYIFFRI